jgi:hypothetical protein
MDNLEESKLIMDNGQQRRAELIMDIVYNGHLYLMDNGGEQNQQ